MKTFSFIASLFLLVGCFTNNKAIYKNQQPVSIEVNSVAVVVLGTIQDAGSPQLGCTKDCCKNLFLNPDKNRKVVSLGIVDAINNKNFLIEATPDITQQAKALKTFSSFSHKEMPDGIFLTHAHIGHYTGLMYLGKEAYNADSVPVFAMPRMKKFLKQNGPWSQLVTNRNITLHELFDGKEIAITKDVKITPFTVPHRDEFSETVGYLVTGPHKKLMFIPDIDKWAKWKTGIIDAISKVDYAFIDATFFNAEEINNRDISTIPHPFIIESMKLFENLPEAEKKKVYFIHFNHTNPVINNNSKQYKQVIQNGFNVASIYDVLVL
ncbi:MAG: MBL fold metallo-hydrolase [Ferruginibacter sp.]|nr:MBL fold metallo-hydrolase [Ferruginibacter sp.]MCC7378855.1 MBL fold metallo-hydrolase [Chitinophagaceae bacterium]